MIQAYELKYCDDHIIYRDKDKNGCFASLITGYIFPKFIDDKPLNCCISNIYDSEEYEKSLSFYDLTAAAKYSYNCFKDMNYDNYALNKWILGKSEMSLMSESFKTWTYDTKHMDKYDEDNYISCYRFDRIENMMRKINSELIQVKLIDCDKIMTTNIFFIPIIQYYKWMGNLYDDGTEDDCITYDDNNYNTLFENIIGLTNTIPRKNNKFNKSLENIYFRNDINYDLLDHNNNVMLNIDELNIHNSYPHDIYQNVYDDIDEFAEYLLNFCDHNKQVKYIKNNIGTTNDYNNVKVYLQNLVESIMLNVTYDYNKFVLDLPDSAIKRRMFDGYIQHFMMRIHNYNEKIKILDGLINDIEYKPSYLSQYKHIHIDEINNVNNIIISTENIPEKNSINETVYITHDNKIHFTNSLISYDDKPTCIKQFRYLVESYGGQCLFRDDQYKSFYDKLPVTCNLKHHFDISINDLIQQKWCFMCNIKALKVLTVKIMECVSHFDFSKLNTVFIPNNDINILEFDGYSEETVKLAIEYRSIHHYKYIPSFHKSIENFEMMINNDKIKDDVCYENDIALFVIPYYVSINDIPKYILNKFLGYGINLNFDCTYIDSSNFIECISDNIDAVQVIKNKNGIIIEHKYNGLITVHTIKCQNGHEFIKHDCEIINGEWCTECPLTNTVSESIKDVIGV